MKTRAEQCKEDGNKCVKEGKFTEAVFHYTEAIKHDPNSAALHSNRSLAFLKLDQLYLALEDAQQAIKLEPSWAKGFFRKGEVEFKAGQYEQALVSYRKAMILDPHDSGILSAMSKTNKEIAMDNKDAARTPTLYAVVGFIVGVIIVIAELNLVEKPFLKHIVLQVLVTLVCSCIGYAFAKFKRYLITSQRNSMLEEPLDLLKEMGEEEEIKTTETKASNSHSHHSQAAGRQRMRKGKSS